MIRLKTEEIARFMDIRSFRSRAALARAAGIHEQHLHRIFNQQADPTLKTLAKICQALQCQPGEILEHVPD